jgi:hypothetical protein
LQKNSQETEHSSATAGNQSSPKILLPSTTAEKKNRFLHSSKMSAEDLQATAKDTTENEEMESGGRGNNPEQALASDGSPAKTYKEKAKENGMNYTVTDVPPLGTSLLLGLQHYLTMLGATVLIPLIVCPQMGANGQQTAQVISSIFFVSGINTVSAVEQCGEECVKEENSDSLSHDFPIHSTHSCFKPQLVIDFPLCKVDRLPFCLRSSRSFSTQNCRPLKTTRNDSR